MWKGCQSNSGYIHRGGQVRLIVEVDAVCERENQMKGDAEKFCSGYGEEWSSHLG